MSENEKEARMRGKRAINMLAQDLAWAADEPVDRIDWDPDPEVEAADHPAAEYQVILATDRQVVKGTLPGDGVGKARDNQVGDEIQSILEGMVGQLKG